MNDRLSKAITRAHAAKAALSRRPTGRLENMVTQEVSLVDRAANERRYIIQKSDGCPRAKNLLVQRWLRFA